MFDLNTVKELVIYYNNKYDLKPIYILTQDTRTKNYILYRGRSTISTSELSKVVLYLDANSNNYDNYCDKHSLEFESNESLLKFLEANRKIIRKTHAVIKKL